MSLGNEIYHTTAEGLNLAVGEPEAAPPSAPAALSRGVAKSPFAQNEITPAQAERAITALEKIGNLCALATSPEGMQLVQAYLKLNSISHLGAALIANGGFDPRRIGVDSTSLTHFVEAMFTKIREVMEAGGVQLPREQRRFESDEKAQYFEINDCNSCNKKGELKSSLEGEIEYWFVECPDGKRSSPRKDPALTVKLWNECNGPTTERRDSKGS